MTFIHLSTHSFLYSLHDSMFIDIMVFKLRSEGWYVETNKQTNNSPKGLWCHDALYAYLGKGVVWNIWWLCLSVAGTGERKTMLKFQRDSDNASWIAYSLDEQILKKTKQNSSLIFMFLKFFGHTGMSKYFIIVLYTDLFLSFFKNNVFMICNAMLPVVSFKD